MRVFLALLIILGLFSGQVLSASKNKPAQANAFRAGYVDLRMVINRVDEGLQAKERLKRKKAAFQRTLNKQQSKLKREKKEMEQQAMLGKLSDEELTKKQFQLRQKIMKLQHIYKALSAKLAKEEALATKALFQKIEPVVKTISKKYKLDFMFEKSKSSVLFAKTRHNYTQELIQLYNKRHPAQPQP